jgi:hypothetical protein
MIETSSASNSIQIRLEFLTKPGMLGRVTPAIGKARGDIGATDIIGFKKNIARPGQLTQPSLRVKIMMFIIIST